MSDDDFRRLVERAQKMTFTPEQREEQRRSFAYGNTHFENEAVTRALVDQAAAEMAKSGAKD